MNITKILNGFLIIIVVISLINVFLADSWTQRFFYLCLSVSCSTVLFKNRRVRIAGTTLALGLLVASML